MNYLVFCVFDLKDAHREDYLYAYMDLAMIGLRKVVQSDGGPSFNLPGRAVMGLLDGRNVEDVRTSIGRKVQNVFKARGLSGDFFVVASSDWACTGDST